MKNKVMKLTLGSIIIAVVSVIGLCVIYSFLQQKSFAKIEPYQINIQLGGVQKNTSLNHLESYSANNKFIIHYDYGFGFNAGHRQVVKSESIPENNKISLSVSAWRTIKTIRLQILNESKDQKEDVQIESFVIAKGGNSYNAISTSQRLGHEDLILFEGIKQNLSGIKTL